MPRTKKPLSRLRELNELFNRRCSDRALPYHIDYLMAHFEIEESQLRNDFAELREQGAKLKSDRKKGYYYLEKHIFQGDYGISTTELHNLNIVDALLEQFGHLYAFASVRETIDKMRRSLPNYDKHKHQKRPPIYFTPMPEYYGTEHLSIMLQAIQESRQITFNYQPYHKDTPDEVVLDPYFLREYDQRWYVGGFSHAPHEQFVRVYPLERIVGHPIMRGYYHDKPAGDFDPVSYWSDIYGISRPGGAVAQEVRLRFHAEQGRYFKSKPFFQPYQVVEDTPEGLVVSMRLVVNQELVSKLAGMGARVKVLQPESLRERLLGFLEEALREGF